MLETIINVIVFPILIYLINPFYLKEKMKIKSLALLSLVNLIILGLNLFFGNSDNLTIVITFVISIMIYMSYIDIKINEGPYTLQALLSILLIINHCYKMTSFNELYGSILSAIIIFVLLFALAYYYEKYKKTTGLGGADIIILTAIAFDKMFLPTMLIIFIAALIGLIISHIEKEKYIPFLPYIFISYIIVEFFGKNILYMYLTLMN